MKEEDDDDDGWHYAGISACSMIYNDKYSMEQSIRGV